MAVNYLQVALQKIKDTASSLGKNFTSYQDQSGYHPSVQLQAAAGVQNLAQNAMQSIPKYTGLTDLTQKYIPNNTARNIVNIPVGLAQGVINAPGDYVAGIAGLGTQIGKGASGQGFNSSQALASAGRLGEGLLNASMIPGATGASEQVAKQTLLNKIKAGAIAGSKYGAGYGALTGLQDTSGGVPGQIKSAAVNAIVGAPAGAVVGSIAGAGEFGAGKLMESMAAKRVAAEASSKQLIDEIPRLLKSEQVVKWENAANTHFQETGEPIFKLKTAIKPAEVNNIERMNSQGVNPADAVDLQRMFKNRLEVKGDVSKLSPEFMLKELTMHADKSGMKPGFVNFNADVTNPLSKSDTSLPPTEPPVGAQSPTSLLDNQSVPMVNPQTSTSPDIINPNVKQRSFLDTVIGSDQTSPSLKEGVSAVTPQTYDVKANKVLTNTAQDAIKTDAGAVHQDVMSNSPANDQKVANAIELSKKYQNEGNNDLAVQVIDHLDQQLREAGRTVQAAKLWNNLTPDGMVRAAEKAAEDVGQQLPKEIKAGVLSKMQEIQGLSGDQKTIKTTELMNYIADNIPASPWEKFKTAFDSYRYNNMLSGPQTHERNIYQNSFNTLVTRPADIAFQAAYDLAKHPFNPLARDMHFSDVPSYYKNLSVTLPESISAASRAFSENMSPKFEDTAGGKSAIVDLRRQKMIPKGLKVIPGMLEAQDKFFSSLISQGEYARLLKGGSSDQAAKDGAQKIADEYLVRTRLGKTTPKDSLAVRALDGIGQSMENMRKLPVVGEAAKWFVPFVQTPINVAKVMVQHSPLGLAGGEMSSKQLAQATSGAVALGAGALFASQGKTTWAAPTDPTQKDLFYASGRQPYSIQVGDKWVPMWYFGPYALSMAIPAAIQNIYQDGKTAMTDTEMAKIGKTISGTMGFLMSQTPMQGTAGLFRLMNGDVSTTVPGMIAGTVSQTIPAESFIRWVNNTFIDPVYRKGSDFASTIKKGLPGLSQTLPAYTLPMSNTPSTRDFGNSFLPYNVTSGAQQYDSLFNQRGAKLQDTALQSAAIKQIEDSKGGSQVIGDGKYAYWDPTSSSAKTIDTTVINSMPSSSNYQKALKEKAAYGLVDNVLNSSLKPEEQQAALKSLGISTEDATYYNVARQSTDLKNVYIQDEISRITAGSKNRADLLNYLVSQRKEVNGSMVLANGVVDQLYQDQIISKDEATKLKNLTIKNGAVKTKLTGRGSRVTIKKVATPSSTPIKAPQIRTMKQLLSTTGKIRSKNYHFKNKL